MARARLVAVLLPVLARERAEEQRFATLPREMTPSGDENLAVRAVGGTWFGPAQ